MGYRLLWYSVQYVTEYQSSHRHMCLWVEFLHQLTDIRIPAIAHGLWVEFLHQLTDIKSFSHSTCVYGCFDISYICNWISPIAAMHMAAMGGYSVTYVTEYESIDHAHGCYGWNSVTYCTEYHPWQPCTWSTGSNSVTYVTEFDQSQPCTWLLWVKLSTVCNWISKQP